MLAFNLKIGDDGAAEVELSLATATPEQKEAAMVLLSSLMTKIGSTMKKYGTGEVLPEPDEEAEVESPDEAEDDDEK